LLSSSSPPLIIIAHLLGLEWAALKTFCLKRNINQKELQFLFKKYVGYDEAHGNGFRVRVSDIREPYLKKRFVRVGVRVVIRVRALIQEILIGMGLGLGLGLGLVILENPTQRKGEA
jgi:hypothetical protein